MEEEEPNIKEMEKKWEILKKKHPDKEKHEFMDSRQREEGEEKGEKKNQKEETSARRKETGDSKTQDKNQDKK